MQTGATPRSSRSPTPLQTTDQTTGVITEQKLLIVSNNSVGNSSVSAASSEVIDKDHLLSPMTQVQNLGSNSCIPHILFTVSHCLPAWNLFKQGKHKEVSFAYFQRSSISIFLNLKQSSNLWLPFRQNKHCSSPLLLRDEGNHELNTILPCYWKSHLYYQAQYL